MGYDSKESKEPNAGTERTKYKKRRNITKKKKAFAVALLEKGVSFRDTSDITGISLGYLQELHKKREILKQKASIIKDVMADEMYAVAQEALTILQDGRLQLEEPVKLSKVIDVMVEKARLMEGKPTDILASYQLVIEKYINPSEASRASEAVELIAEPSEAV